MTRCCQVMGFILNDGVIMPEYTFADFLDTLDDKGVFVMNALNNHIAANYPEYKPFDIKPTDKSNISK